MTKCLVCHHDLVGRGKGYCRHCLCQKKKHKKRSIISRHERHGKCQRIRFSSTARTTTTTNASRTAAPQAPPTCCENCSFLFNNIKTQLDSAKRSAEEVARCRRNGANKVSLWNLGQLKHILQPHMLMLKGGAYKQQLCSKCLQNKFGVGRKWGNRFFHKCVAKIQSTEMTKADIVADTSFDRGRVIIPFTASTTSKVTYLKSLDNDDVVHVEKVVSFNNGAGQARGNAAIFANVHRLFNQWVRAKNIEKNSFFLCFFASQQKSKKIQKLLFFLPVF